MANLVVVQNAAAVLRPGDEITIGLNGSSLHGRVAQSQSCGTETHGVHLVHIDHGHVDQLLHMSTQHIPLFVNQAPQGHVEIVNGSDADSPTKPLVLAFVAMGATREGHHHAGHGG